MTLCSKNVERGPLRRERNDIIFLRAKSKVGDDDRWALNREWRSFETKAQHFNFRQLVKKRKLSRPPSSYSLGVSHNVSVDALQVSRPDGANGKICSCMSVMG